jgi:dTMP kinase
MSLFITFEGPEGSGKSTQIKLLCTYLLAQDYPVVQTREPGGTAIGDQIRKVLLSPEHAEMLPVTEFLLFSASRAQLVSQFIRPHLAAGRTVLCDRYADSSLAYQGYAQGLDPDRLRQITRFATGGLTPDCTIYFDLEVTVGLQRKQHASVPLDRLDAKSIEFHERVRRGYLAMAAQEPDRWYVVNAEANVNTVQGKVRQHVEQLITGQTTRA